MAQTLDLAATIAPAWLSDAQRATLDAICATLLPALDVAPADDPSGHLRRPASAMLVADRLAETLGVEDDATRAEFKQLLDLLGGPAGGMLLVGRPVGFARLSPQLRERALQAMANSGVAKLRQGFQAIKRLGAFIYYTAPAPDGGDNPNWPDLGFSPPAPPPATPKTIQPLTIQGATTLDADVVVIGSGAGGGVIAGELARAGRSVIVLEKGGYYNEADFDGREATMMPKLYLKRGLQSTRDLSVSILAGSCLGGGTVVNWNTSFRAPAEVLGEWERDFGLAGFGAAALTPHYDAVAARVGVNSDDSAPNANNAVLERGCERLGYDWGVIPRNASDCRQRCGACGYGCALSRKQSTLITYLQDAADHGARFVVNCAVDRVMIARERATGVQATVTDPATGARHAVTVRARAVVVAAGALHSPAVLLRSGVRNPNLGRHLRLHPVVSVSGFYAEPIRPWEGSLQTRYSAHFAHQDGAYGYTIELAPVHPGIVALSQPWASGDQFKRQMRRAAHVAPLIILVRDRNGGTVTLDKHGEPVIDYPLGAYERRMLIHGAQEGAKIHRAAGAATIGTLHSRPTLLDLPGGAADSLPPGEWDAFLRTIAARGVAPNRVMIFSAHQMGTCRLAADARRGVVNPEHAVFGVRGLYVADGSNFPTATGVNPMLTILALAHHAAAAINAAL